MNTIKITLLSVVLTGCTYAPNNAKTTNNYFGGSSHSGGLRGSPMRNFSEEVFAQKNRFGYESDEEILLKLSVIDDLEKVIDQLK